MKNVANDDWQKITMTLIHPVRDNPLRNEAEHILFVCIACFA